MTAWGSDSQSGMPWRSTNSSNVSPSQSGPGSCSPKPVVDVDLDAAERRREQLGRLAAPAGSGWRRARRRPARRSRPAGAASRSHCRRPSSDSPAHVRGPPIDRVTLASDSPWRTSTSRVGSSTIRPSVQVGRSSDVLRPLDDRPRRRTFRSEVPAPGDARSVGSGQWRPAIDRSVDSRCGPATPTPGPQAIARRRRRARAAARRRRSPSPTSSSSRATSTTPAVDRLGAFLADPLLQTGTWDVPDAGDGPHVEITLHPGVTDGAADAVVHAAAPARRRPSTAAATGRRIELPAGTDRDDADVLLRRLVANPIIEHWTTGTADARPAPGRRRRRRRRDDRRPRPRRRRPRRASAPSASLALDPEELAAIRDHFDARRPRPDRRRAGDAGPDVERALRPQDVPGRDHRRRTAPSCRRCSTSCARATDDRRRAVRALGVRRQRRHRVVRRGHDDRPQGRDPQPPVGGRAVRRRQHRRRRRHPRRDGRGPPPDRRHRRPLLRPARPARRRRCPTARCTRAASATA